MNSIEFRNLCNEFFSHTIVYEGKPTPSEWYEFLYNNHIIILEKANIYVDKEIFFGAFISLVSACEIFFGMSKEDVQEKCYENLKLKGDDYSSSTDRLSNFKDVGKRIKESPMTIWLVYFEKHIFAIERWVRDGKISSEPIEGRFIDAINYVLLGAGLEKESKCR